MGCGASTEKHTDRENEKGTQREREGNGERRGHRREGQFDVPPSNAANERGERNAGGARHNNYFPSGSTVSATPMGSASTANNNNNNPAVLVPSASQSSLSHTSQEDTAHSSAASHEEEDHPHQHPNGNGIASIAANTIALEGGGSNPLISSTLWKEANNGESLRLVSVFSPNQEEVCIPTSTSHRYPHWFGTASPHIVPSPQAAASSMSSFEQVMGVAGGNCGRGGEAHLLSKEYLCLHRGHLVCHGCGSLVCPVPKETDEEIFSAERPMFSISGGEILLDGSSKDRNIQQQELSSSSNTGMHRSLSPTVSARLEASSMSNPTSNKAVSNSNNSKSHSEKSGRKPSQSPSLPSSPLSNREVKATYHPDILKTTEEFWYVTECCVCGAATQHSKLLARAALLKRQEQHLQQSMERERERANISPGNAPPGEEGLTAFRRGSQIQVEGEGKEPCGEFGHMMDSVYSGRFNPAASNSTGTGAVVSPRGQFGMSVTSGEESPRRHQQQQQHQPSGPPPQSGPGASPRQPYTPSSAPNGLKLQTGQPYTSSGTLMSGSGSTQGISPAATPSGNAQQQAMAMAAGSSSKGYREGKGFNSHRSSAIALGSPRHLGQHQQNSSKRSLRTREVVLDRPSSSDGKHTKEPSRFMQKISLGFRNFTARIKYALMSEDEKQFSVEDEELMAKERVKRLSAIPKETLTTSEIAELKDLKRRIASNEKRKEEIGKWVAHVIGSVSKETYQYMMSSAAASVSGGDTSISPGTMSPAVGYYSSFARNNGSFSPGGGKNADLDSTAVLHSAENANLSSGPGNHNVFGHGSNNGMLPPVFDGMAQMDDSFRSVDHLLPNQMPASSTASQQQQPMMNNSTSPVIPAISSPTSSIDHHGYGSNGGMGTSSRLSSSQLAVFDERSPTYTGRGFNAPVLGSKSSLDYQPGSIFSGGGGGNGGSSLRNSFRKQEHQPPQIMTPTAVQRRLREKGQDPLLYSTVLSCTSLSVLQNDIIKHPEKYVNDALTRGSEYSHHLPIGGTGVGAIHTSSMKQGEGHRGSGFATPPSLGVSPGASRRESTAAEENPAPLLRGSPQHRLSKSDSLSQSELHLQSTQQYQPGASCSPRDSKQPRSENTYLKNNERTTLGESDREILNELC